MTYHRSKGGVVLLSGSRCFKVYFGANARLRIERTLMYTRLAGRSEYWGESVLPLSKVRGVRATESVRCQPLHGEVRDAAADFVNSTIRMILRDTARMPALSLFPWRELQSTIDESLLVRLFRCASSRVKQEKLPVGATHGDLHEGNILSGLNDKLFIIDWDRYRLEGCPLFDLLQYRLNSLCVASGRFWIDMLFRANDLIEEVAGDQCDPSVLRLFYAINRIGGESYARLLRGESLNKYQVQVSTLLEEYE